MELINEKYPTPHVAKIFDFKIFLKDLPIQTIAEALLQW